MAQGRNCWICSREALPGWAQLRAHITSCQGIMAMSWPCWNRETTLCKMSDSALESWLAKPSKCPGNSTAFQIYLSLCDLQRGSLAWLQSHFMAGWEIFIYILKTSSSSSSSAFCNASMLASPFTGPTPALFYYPCRVCQYVYSLSCKVDEISLLMTIPNIKYFWAF